MTADRFIAVVSSTTRTAAADQERQTAQQKQQLLATISEKWLLGAWIAPGDPSENCGNGQALWFERGHVLEGALGKGRGTLTGDQLHLIGGDGRLNFTAPIVKADAVSFSIANDKGELADWRRCTRTEVETLPEPTEAEGD